ncbi:MAG: glycerophosphodiester phosphodiesterase [Planctomycetaceae bacterium]
MPSFRFERLTALAVDMAASLVRRWRSLAALGAMLWLISFVLLTPFVAALLRVLLTRTAGFAAIGNMELATFAASAPGLLTVTLVPTVALALVYFEQACLVHLLSRPQSSVRRALLSGLRRAPKLLGLALLQTIVTIAVLLPFVVAAGFVYWLLLSGADINFFLARRPPRFMAAVAIGAVLAVLAAAALVWLVVQWFVAVPVIMCEGADPRQALKTSAQRARKHRLLVLPAAALWLTGRIACSAVLALLLALLADYVFLRSGDTLTSALWGTAGLFVVNSAVLLASAVIDQSLYAAAVWHVYARTAPEPFPRSADDAPASTGMFRIRSLPLAAAGVVLVAAAGAYAWLAATKLTARQAVKVTAHRAGPIRAPENSLAALRQAIAEGAQAAEIDVQLSSDGVVVVVHDQDLKRLAGAPLVVSRSTYEELRGADIGRLHQPPFVGERIATLAEFIEEARGKIGLSIELKYYGAEPRLADSVVRLLEEQDFVEQATVISLEYDALIQVRRLAPQIRLGYLVSASLGDVTRLDVEFLSVSRSRVSPQLLGRAKAAGLKVAVWTVDRPSEMTRLILQGVDDLVTDDPRTAIAAVREYNGLNDVELLMLRVRQALSR